MNRFKFFSSLGLSVFLAQTVGAAGPADLSTLMLSAANGEKQIIAEATAAELLVTNENQSSVLYFAAQASVHAIEIFEIVRSRIATGEFERLLNLQTKSNGHTVAFEAVFNGNQALVRYLTELKMNGVRIDFESPSVFGWTPKTFAQREKMKFASEIPEGAIKAEDRLKWMEEQENRWVGLLSRADRQFHSGGLELIAAIEDHDHVKIETLVRSGVGLNQRYGRLGATPLNSSVRPGLTGAELQKVMQTQNLLLKLGANPLLQEGGIMMVSSGFRESVFGYAELVQNMLNQFGGNLQGRQEYLDAQGPINGYTKLIDAALRGNVKVIEVLVAAGAEKNLRGHNGTNAYAAALIYNQQSPTPLADEILQLLRP